MLSFITKGYFRGLTPAQQQPFFAVAGNAAVFTHSSGDLKADFAARNKLQNHFPHIEQNKNVAILLYRPNRDLLAFRRGGLPVSLHWPDYMDEDIEVDHWKIGRSGQNYVAMWTPCEDKPDEFVVRTGDRQVWALVVGTEETH